MKFFEGYCAEVCRHISELDALTARLLARELKKVAKRGNKVIVAGNGGSAAMAAHVAVDLTKVAGVRAVTFNEADLLTCFSNDYGYDQWVAKALEFYADAGDAAILISSSGKSPNMINGARKASELGLFLATFSGFRRNNPLRSIGRMNFWVNSDSYNVVEMTHHVWLLAVVDYLAAGRKQ